MVQATLSGWGAVSRVAGVGQAMNPARVEANVDPAAWLLTGQVMHERLRPKHHRFTYPVFCVRCDLDRLASLDSRWFGVEGSISKA